MDLLNFRSKLILDDLNTLQTTIQTEFLNRQQMLMGAYRVAGASFGIVAEASPLIANSSQPFQITASATPFSVDVTAGSAVTRAGEIVIQPTTTIGLGLADITETVVNLVIAEFHLDEVDPRPSIFDETIIYAQAVRGTIIRCVTLAQYNDIGVFPTDRIQNTVVLAACTVFKNSSGILTVNVDTTNSIYAFMRPWFSPVDIQHRAAVGSGAVTATNPHGYSFSDLTAGNLTIYQQMLSRGVVLSKDLCVSNIPGCAVTEDFDAASIVTDDGLGTVTGVPNALYVRANNYPIQVIAAYDSVVNQNKFAAKIVPGTNIIMFSQYDLITAVTIRYLYASALQSPTVLLNNLVTVQQPLASEVAIGEGHEFSEIVNPTINFEGSGPIPFRFRVYLTSDGTLAKNPFAILPAIKLAAITVPYSFDLNLVGESQIIVGMTQATLGCTVVLKIIGSDSDGNQINENITFGPTWTDSVVPNSAVNPNQFQKSTLTYLSIKSIEVVSRSGDGNNSTIIAYADATTSFYEALLAYEVHWNGLALLKITDKRKIIPFLGGSPGVPPEESPVHTAYMLNKVDPANFPYTSQTYRILHEDFLAPRFIDLIETASAPTQPTGTISINNIQLNIADTVTIAPGKTITAMATGANSNLGQFNIDGADSRANMVAAINDPVFASGVVGVVGTGTLINLTAATNDNNYALAKFSGNPTAITVNGYTNGFLQEVAIISDRFSDVLDTDPPTPTPEVVANKYRSNAIAVPQNNVTRLLVVGFGVDRFDGMFAAASYQARPSVWEPKIAATTFPVLNVWLLTFPQPIAKFYISFFGRAKGLAIYAIL
jgi:hypothetical protein